MNCKDCFAQIHFVNNKSLSSKAIRKFLDDVEKNGYNKKRYKGRFRKAVFFVLLEKRKEGKSISGWIFLKDGTIILWDLWGEHLMNFPDEFIPKQTYCTIEIKKEDFTELTPEN
jgi:hypothetical protein